MGIPSEYRVVGFVRGLACLPRVTGARAAHLEQAALRARVSDQVVRRAVGDRRADHVARARTTRLGHTLGQGDVHETVVAGASRNTVCGTILTAITLGDEDLDLGPGQRGVILGADTLLELDETLVTLERNVVRHLIPRGPPRAYPGVESRGT